MALGRQPWPIFLEHKDENNIYNQCSFRSTPTNTNGDGVGFHQELLDNFTAYTS